MIFHIRILKYENKKMSLFLPIYWEHNSDGTFEQKGGPPGTYNGTVDSASPYSRPVQRKSRNQMVVEQRKMYEKGYADGRRDAKSPNVTCNDKILRTLIRKAEVIIISEDSKWSCDICNKLCHEYVYKFEDIVICCDCGN